MTTAAILDLHARPERLPEPGTERRRHLRALPRPALAPRRAPRLVHAVIALAGLAGVVSAQLGLSVAISEGAYRLSDLQVQSTTLARAEQTLAEDVAVLSSPQHVAVAADELGMLAGQPSQFLTLAGTATAGGPDATHMQVPALDRFGMYVPNALLDEQPQAAAVVQQAQVEAARPYPGMLLPAGEAAFTPGQAAEQPGRPQQAGPAGQAGQAGGRAPGTLLPPSANAGG